MHEMSIAKNLFEIIKEEMERYGVQKVREIKIRVGVLTGIVPDSLRFCFGFLAQNTPAQDAKILIEKTPLKVFCKVCKDSFEMEDYEFICPRCGNEDVEIISGKELFIEGMEVI